MTHLKITGMTCDSCAAHVKEALEKVPGVQSALVSYPKGTAQLAIVPGTSPDALTAAVAGLGYKATLADAPLADNRVGLLDKVRGWMAAAEKHSGNEPVERTFAWINRNRRLAKDFEHTIRSATAFLYAAAALILVRRLGRYV